MNKELLEILACPVPECRKPIVQPANDENALQCTGCGRIYPIVDGIPIMLVDRAKKPK
ncbi:MAG TPA: Trm112 family protein [Candidatus Saccharimonadales bacterium]|nr:Trm112 family protein [Candidatus Saccharimonadales bacterium]